MPSNKLSSKNTPRVETDETEGPSLASANHDGTTMQFVTYVALGIGGLVVLGLMFKTVLLAIVPIPFVLWYLHSTCPSDESFDTK